MKIIRKIVIASLLMVFSGLPHAHALDFSVLGALTVSNYNLNPQPTGSSVGTGYGFGGTVGWDLSPFVSMESGVLFLSHAFSYTNNAGGTTAVTSNFTKIPVWFRFSPISLISLNVGPYMGLATAASPGGFATDYGFHVGASLRLGLVPMLKLRVDALYEYGLANLASANLSTQNSRDILIFAGLMLDLF